MGGHQSITMEHHETSNGGGMTARRWIGWWPRLRCAKKKNHGQVGAFGAGVASESMRKSSKIKEMKPVTKVVLRENHENPLQSLAVIPSIILIYSNIRVLYIIRLFTCTTGMLMLKHGNDLFS